MKRSVRDYWRVFRFLVASGLRERMQYRANFLLTAVMRSLSLTVDFILVAVILARFELIHGWDVYDVALLYGLVTAGRGWFDTLAREFDRFEHYLVSGEYDGILVRPWPTAFALLARRIDVARAGPVLQGILIAGIGAAGVMGRGGLGWAGAAYLFLGIPLFGAMILTAVSMVTAAIGFWIIRIDELTVFTIYAPTAASVFPLSIYPNWLRGLLHTAIPVAFAGYLPVQYLLGKGAGPWTLLASPAVAALSLVLAGRIWQIGERRYQGTGS
jgi:ABC-2 type transport system permease protein